MRTLASNVLDSRILAVALSSAVLAAFMTLGTGLYFSAREAKKQRAIVCQAAIVNRQVLRDIVALVQPGEFRTRAEQIVSRPVPCDPKAP